MDSERITACSEDHNAEMVRIAEEERTRTGHDAAEPGTVSSDTETAAQRVLDELKKPTEEW